MRNRHVDAARQLIPDADVSHAFQAGRRWPALVATPLVAVVVAAIDATWLAVAAGSVAGLLVHFVAGSGRIVALTPSRALIFATRRIALTPTADRLIDEAARGAVERSMAGPLNERWRFGDHSLLIQRDDGWAVDRWNTSN